MRDRASGEVMHPGAGPLRRSRDGSTSRRRDWRARLRERRRHAGAASTSDSAPPRTRSPPGRCRRPRRTSARRLEIVSFEHDLDALELALQPEHADALRDSRRTGQCPRRGERAARATAATRRRARSGGSASATFQRRWPRAGRLRRHRVLGSVFREDAPASVDRRRRSTRCGACVATGATVHTYSASTSTRSGFLLGGFAVGVGDRTGARDETTIAATRLEDLAKPLGASLAGASLAFVGAVPERRAE